MHLIFHLFTIHFQSRYFDFEDSDTFSENSFCGDELDDQFIAVAQQQQQQQRRANDSSGTPTTPCYSTGNDHHHHHSNVDNTDDDFNNSNDAMTSRATDGDFAGHTTHQEHQHHHSNGNGHYYCHNEDDYCDQVYSSDRCRFINSTPDAQFSATHSTTITTSTSPSTAASSTSVGANLADESFVNSDPMTPTPQTRMRPNLSNCESLSDLSASRHEASNCDAIERAIQAPSSMQR